MTHMTTDPMGPETLLRDADQSWRSMARAVVAPLLAAVLFLVLAPAAFAQSPAPATEGTAAPPQEQPAPYDPQFERLSEILGSVHYLRSLCGAEEGQKWRSRMQALIDAEDPSVKRRAKMVNAFNRGYRGFQRTHTTCTENSRLLIDRFMREGSQIASLIATRYGS
jgi:uncharacterized protein (TIGR02301 family)